jgi:hypothetical protein
MSFAEIWADLATTVVEPVKTWLKARPFWLRALLVFAIPLGILGYNQRALLGRAFNSAGDVFRVATSDDRIPLTREYREELARLGSRVETQARADLLHELNDSDDGGWAAAQLAVALAKRDALSTPQRERVVAFLLSQRRPGEPYWAQKIDPPHLAVTAWCIHALAVMKQPVGTREITYVLEQQMDDGGWPLYGDLEARQASVFATALMIIALKAHVSATSSIGNVEAINGALDRAEGWLVQYCDRSRARWKFYPLVPDSPESEADSGLALYALNQLTTVPSTNREFGAAWLRSLPTQWPKHAFDREASGQWFGRGKRARPDTVSHLKLPWLITGTAVSYAGATTWDKLRALHALESCIDQQDWGIGGYWSYQRAELLIAIGELEHRTAS